MASKAQCNDLFDLFRSNFNKLDKRRVELLFLMVRAISSVGTVNLVKVAAALQTDVAQSSNYRRIQRFIHKVRGDFSILAPFIIKLAGVHGPYTLLLDRTNWQFGRVGINFLVLSVKGKSWSVPLLWMLLSKKGSSNEQERIALLDKFIAIFGQGKIHTLLADREFIGKNWIAYLNKTGIPYDIRIRENMKVIYNGHERRVSGIFSKLEINQLKTLKKPVMLHGNLVYMQGTRIVNTKNHKEEYLIIISYDDPENGISRYRDRWYIENMFKDLKSNGFNLECTHITKPERLETLMLILAIAYTWMIKIGNLIQRKFPKRVKIKNHGRRSKSTFRLGLDEFLTVVFSMDIRKITYYIRFLSCT